MLRDRTILVADDEEGLTALFAASLRNVGYRVREALDGEQALQAFLAAPESYELLIADVRMPFITGLELAKIAFEYGRPSLLISGSELPPEAGGRWDFLLKPFANDVLIQAVRGILERRGCERRSEFMDGPTRY